MSISSVFKIVVLLSSLAYYVDTRGVNGGFSCGACTILFGIASQLSEIHNESLMAASLRLCDILPSSARSYCGKAVRKLEPLLIDPDVIRFFTPDVLCYGIGSCYVDKGEQYCRLFPKPLSNFHNEVKKIKTKLKSHSVTSPLGEGFDFCRLPVIDKLCWTFNKTWTNMEPAVDVDGDRFSLLPSARGSNWRGRDCRDFDSQSYPGRNSRQGDIESDSNCNGIWGRNPKTGESYEQELCGDTEARGLIYIGDSVGSHFHFPEAWINPELITWESMHNYTDHVLDELDWPQLGFATGFTNTTETLLIQGYTDSLYLKLLARNRCNHRDYQNLSRNGASSFDLTNYVKNIARNRTTDKPALVIYGAFGNDVCNMYKDTLASMTTPKQFRKNVLGVLDYLNASLPVNSHVLLIALVDAGFIYPTMADRLHPLGQLRGDVRYRDVYDWFTCTQIGPCLGWMTGNSTLRKYTSMRAIKLNNVLESLAISEEFVTFKLHFIENPLQQVFDKWKQLGYPAWKLIDNVDSLHPSQMAQPLIADTLWQNILDKLPEVLGNVNPNNVKILDLFGNQGGH